MTNPPSLSPAARSFQRRKHLGWGIALVALALLVVLADGPIALGALAGLLGVVLLAVGVIGEQKANAYNRRDWALAESLAGQFEQLLSHDGGTAYGGAQGEYRVQNARLVEIERHFDSQTAGAITGVLHHQLRMFGSTVSGSVGVGTAVGNRSAVGASVSSGSFSGLINGLSNVELGLSSTTRNDLMGDALFSVFEAPDANGRLDTHRVVSMSQPGAAGWINDVVQQTAQRFDGQRTHSGATVLGFGPRIVSHFVPKDISYVTDQLRAQQNRDRSERELIRIRGTAVGRNAMIATCLSVGGRPELRLMPIQFPAVYGEAVARGIARADTALNGVVANELR
ncbi:hypothetical protein [Naumannella halotolerans]|nr:hypothetical protein [Naumannella halotolerans]